uniref:Protein pecanex n=1 Tax=Lygus hesperus TaxID=30085 RepID=A0A0A9XCB9_LYGHE
MKKGWCSDNNKKEEKDMCKEKEKRIEMNEMNKVYEERIGYEKNTCVDDVLDSISVSKTVSKTVLKELQTSTLTLGKVKENSKEKVVSSKIIESTILPKVSTMKSKTMIQSSQDEIVSTQQMMLEKQ